MGLKGDAVSSKQMADSLGRMGYKVKSCEDAGF